MKFLEYIKKNYPIEYSVIVDNQVYDECYNVFFPSCSEINYLITELNYLPFVYDESDTTSINYYGGLIVKQLSEYLLFNFIENNINDKLTIVNNQHSALRKCVTNLMLKNKYKWSGLYKTMTVDGDYSVLDNVNEVFEEKTLRAPDIVESERGQLIHGNIRSERTDVYGARNNSRQYTKGQRSDTSSTTIGALSVDTEVSELRDNDTTTTNHSKVPNNQSTAKVTDSDVATSTYGDKQTIQSQNTSQQLNSESITSGSQTDNETDTQSTYTDSSTNTTQAVTDTNELTKTTTGEEEITITRRRHGNIGVTTSGQLIEDYRKTHNFNLIKVIGDDIANEIFSLVWG